MTLFKSLLLGTAAGIVATAGASAADLPSKKAAPVNYVKICDAYGAGFFYMPGTETCIKLGGFVRYEMQYAPGKDLYTGQLATPTQVAGNQDTLGNEYRGRIEVDARTPTSYGVARTFIALRGTGQTGLRGAAYNFNTAIAAPNLLGTNAALTMERAFVQFAGFTAGLATSSYAMMPSTVYGSSPWAGFPNGQRQLSYTAVFPGGFSATLALEDKQMWGYDQTYNYTPTTGVNLVGNVRLEQAWGFVAIHGLVTKNGYATNALNATAPAIFSNSMNMTNAPLSSGLSKSAWALGTTVQIKLPQLATGDALWLTANYTDGYLGAILGAGSLMNLSNGSGGRILGGVPRQDFDVVFNGTTASNTKGWNLAGQLTHYWASDWRSNFVAGYIEFNPPSQTGNTAAWGKARTVDTLASIIWSPAANFDIGLELQYLNTKSSLQNAANAGLAAWRNAGYPGLNNSNFSTKLRVERSF